MAFGSIEDAAAWVAERGGDLEQLRTAIANGSMRGRNRMYGLRYVELRDRQEATGQSLEALELQRQATQAAKDSARWAGWAMVISLGALALSAWPYIQTRLQ